MEYKVNHTINDNTINIQVIHNKTDAYYETNIENNDMNKQLFENIKDIQINSHICDTKLYLFLDYKDKSYEFQLNKKEASYIEYTRLEEKYNKIYKLRDLDYYKNHMINVINTYNNTLTNCCPPNLKFEISLNMIDELFMQLKLSMNMIDETFIGLSYKIVDYYSLPWNSTQKNRHIPRLLILVITNKKIYKVRVISDNFEKSSSRMFNYINNSSSGWYTIMWKLGGYYCRNYVNKLFDMGFIHIGDKIELIEVHNINLLIPEKLYNFLDTCYGYIEGYTNIISFGGGDSFNITEDAFAFNYYIYTLQLQTLC